MKYLLSRFVLTLLLVSYSLFSTVAAQTSQKTPKSITLLALNLDNTRIVTVSDSKAKAKFDLDGSGVMRKTGWVGVMTSILVLDRNGDGKIDIATEVFGNRTVKNDGSIARHGFDALRDLDTNNDGVFDSNDMLFLQVRLWVDFNQDGVTQADELYTLKDFNIKSISLKNQVINKEDNGNTIFSQSTFTREDNRQGVVAYIKLTVGDAE